MVLTATLVGADVPLGAVGVAPVGIVTIEEPEDELPPPPHAARAIATGATKLARRRNVVFISDPLK